VLLRHGETEWNAEGRYATRSDVPLSARGRAQAVRAAGAFASAPIDQVVSSPLSRALETARIITAACHACVSRPTVDHRLVEIDAGPFEGKTPRELAGGPLREAFASWQSDAHPTPPPGAETLESAVLRLHAAGRDLRRLPGTTLAVTHGSLARVFVCAVGLGAAPWNYRRLWLGNCRCAVFDTDGPELRLLAFNASPEDVVPVLDTP
jgi:glucosyl-3-phosphoglycerate phosphatase